MGVYRVGREGGGGGGRGDGPYSKRGIGIMLNTAATGANLENYKEKR